MSALREHGQGLTMPMRNRLRRRLTDEQARELRLSLDTNAEAGRRYGLETNAITMIRTGRNYGPLQDDEKAAAERRRHRNDHPFLSPAPTHVLMVGQLFTRDGLREQDRQEMMDAAQECAHGRLPYDTTAACGCWPQEALTDQPQGGPNGSHIHHERLGRFAEQAHAQPPRPDARVAEDRPIAA